MNDSVDLVDLESAVEQAIKTEVHRSAVLNIAIFCNDGSSYYEGGIVTALLLIDRVLASKSLKIVAVDA